ncbi:MAG: STAS domain-containing protein [Vampirovibrionia bacterium]
MANIKVIRIEDEKLDFFNVANLESKMIGLFREKPDVILFDMTNVQMADSRAIGLFVGFKIQSDAKDIEFGLFGLTKDVQYIFKVTTIDKTISIFEDEQEALEKLEDMI